MEFENCSSVKANTRRSTPVVISASTWAFTFSTPESANTTGVVSEDATRRLASSSTATLLPGANMSATRHARIRREKLSITAWRYARVPSSRRMTVVSMCHISSARVVRRPTFGFAGCTRSRGRRQPCVRTRRYQVDGEAETVASRWARTASVPVGTCRYAGEVTMTSMTRTSAGLSRCGEVRGHDDWSSSAHAVSCRRQAWNRLGDTCRNRSSARNGMHARAQSTAPRIRLLSWPSGNRSRDKVKRETLSSVSTNRNNAVSFRTRRRCCRISWWRSSSVRCVPSRLTTTVALRRSHPRAVERGTPRSVARVTSPVRRTRSQSRWS